MRAHQTDFSRGNVYRNILEVAIPLTLAQLLNLLYNVVDRIYIGRIPEVGTLALTGVGLCFPVISLVTAFTYLYGNGGSPLCAMERGRGNKEEAEKIMGNSFILLVYTGVILMTLGFIFYKPFLYLFGASDATFPYAGSYMRIYLLGTVFVMISVGMNPFINSQGFGNIGMLTVLIGAVLNIMRVKSILGLGVSGFIMAFTNSLVQIVCNSTLQTFGGDIYVGVMTVLSSVRDICTMPVMGLTNGASPVMSFNYGEKAYDRVKKAIRFVTVICVTYTFAAWGLLKLIPEVFIRIFNTDPQLVVRSIPALHIYFFGFCFMALQFTGQSVFVALGKSKQATFFSLLRKAIIVVPLTLILPHMAGLGVDGVFWAEPVSNLFGGCACFFTMLATVMPELKKEK